HKGHLRGNISFWHALHLTLAYHVHRFIPPQGLLCGLEGKEAKPWFDEPFDEPMVLFDQIIEVFHLSEFHAFRENPSRFEVCNGFGIGSILIYIDHTYNWLR